MNVRYLIIRLLLVACVSAAPAAHALDPQIRLYKIDKKQDFTKSHYLFGKADNPGCHNLPFRYPVYKATVIKFKSCSLFSKKDCEPASILPAYWKNKDEPSTELTRGAHWHLDRNDDNVDVASWSCE